MKRVSYVDEEGKVIDQTFESRKAFLYTFFVFETIVPLVLLGFIFYTMYDNSKCLKVYKNIEDASLKYMKENNKIPEYDGESVNLSVDDLYAGNYLKVSEKKSKLTGKIKATKYKGKYVYTLDVDNCGSCSTDKRYKEWSAEVNNYPSSKTMVDVVPYYNYYDKEISTTKWSGYFEDSQLEVKESKYGVRLPLKQYERKLPTVPNEAEIVEVQTDDKYEYRYKDLEWLWYDIEGDYSDFSSEQPPGYANKDSKAKRYTEWSEFSLDYPEEKEYREIYQTTGRKYYYLDKNGQKVYANNGKYTEAENVNRKEYNLYEKETVTLYRYRDMEWRWYNGTKRRYSNASSTAPKKYPYRDDGTVTETSYSNWSATSKITKDNSSYRTEETRTLTRFRYVYQTLSFLILPKPVDRETFTKTVSMSVPEFAGSNDHKLEISYKFKYRKR